MTVARASSRPRRVDRRASVLRLSLVTATRGNPMSIERIYIAGKAGEPQIEVRTIASSPAPGSRRSLLRRQGQPGQNITLVEAEEIEAFGAETGRSIDPSSTRRNLVTRGVRLKDLVGREFTVGNVRLRGVELCEPCGGLGHRLSSADITPAAVVRRFVHRAGIRADVLGSGSITVGAGVRAAD
jgi:MOSC domain-containing protein YiiM